MEKQKQYLGNNYEEGTTGKRQDCVQSPPVNLTGVWNANDGAHYYIRQIGTQVWWAGLNSGGEGTVFTNVFR